MNLNNWTFKRSFKKVFCLNVCNKEPWLKIIKLFDKKGGDIKIFTFRDAHRILARTSRSKEVINYIPWGICGVKKSPEPWRTSFPPAIPRIIEYDLSWKSRFLQYLRIHLSFF